MDTTVSVIGDDVLTAALIEKKLPESIDGIIIDEALTSIGNSAFYSLDNLKEIHFKYVRTIEKDAFNSCTALSVLDLPSLEEIVHSGFKGCKSLQEINFPLVIRLGQDSFNGCSGIVRVRCIKAEEVSSGVFEQCSSLTEVYLPNVSVCRANVFNDCIALKTIVMESCTTIGAAFHNCKVLEKVFLPSMKRITDGLMFKGSDNLKEINLGDKIEAIANTAFAYTPSGVVINLGVSEGAVSGAPWGAEDAVINYDVPYVGPEDEESGS